MFKPCVARGHLLKILRLAKSITKRQAALGVVQVRDKHQAIDLSCQTKLIPGPERIRVHPRTPDDLSQPFPFQERRDIKTVYDMFHNGWKESENGKCLGTKNSETGKYEWIDYAEVWESGINTGCGFLDLGYPAGQETLVGISCKNRKEFVFSYLGTMAFSSVIVPFYNHMPPDAVTFIIQQTEIPIFVCDTEEKANFIISNRVKFPKLKHLIYIERPTKDMVASAKAVDLRLHYFRDVQLAGKGILRKSVKPKPDDLFTICWTSGTTGMPKGVMLTHRNVTSAQECFVELALPVSFKRKTIISYMPTGHIYELMIELDVLSVGGSVGFFGGDVLKLMDDIKTLQPEIVPMVPRILNRLYTKLISDIQRHPFKRWFFKMALEAKLNYLKKGVVTKDTIWDKLVFQHVREAFGGKAECIITSAAPIADEPAKFFRCATGCYIFDVYGQTEVIGVTGTSPFDYKGGNIGFTLPGTRMKVVDVPEMGYLAKEDIGEICIKGPTVTKGYFKNPKSTEETIDKDGWLHTGDIGKWLPDGTLSIVDRKKNLFKLSQGEYISPERIENVYIRSKLIGQLIVEGESNKEYPVTIVMPDSENFVGWAKHKGFQSDSMKELCNDKSVRKTFLEHIQKQGNKGKLTTIEQVKNVHLHPTLLTIDDGHITPTLKMKRNVVKKYFSEQIAALYAEGPILDTDKVKMK